LGRLTTVGVIVGGALAGLGAFNTWLSWQAGPLESALPGRGRFYHWTRDGQIANVYYHVSDGDGPPVVLIHGIDAAASSYEMRHVFAGLSEGHRVYAIDLLGFGLSDRLARRYRPADYLDLIEGFLRDVVGAPAAVVASSLSAAYAVTVASRSPELIHSLLLICPTGLERLAGPAERWQQRLGKVLRLPILGTTVFNLLVSRQGLRYFLGERTFADAARVTDELIDAYYRASHQEGARHAPSSFIAGDLNLSIRETYPTLTQRVAIVWGREAKITPVSDANLFIQSRPQTHLKVIERCGLLPQDEQAAEFVEYAKTTLAMVER
jgi:pimeloyl-ACP methyl ester carboxylesterase